MAGRQAVVIVQRGQRRHVVDQRVGGAVEAEAGVGATRVTEAPAPVSML
jgi:hypothetical protein